MENAKPGHAVKFHSLKGAAHLNGTEGYLVKFLKKEQRWAVRCDDNEQVVNAKPENLERVSGIKYTEEQKKDDLSFQNYLEEQRRKPKPPLPKITTSSSHSDTNSLLEAVVDSYHKWSNGGAVVFYGNSYMLALEFNGPHYSMPGSIGITADMVYVDETQQSQAVVRERRCTTAK